MGVNAFENSEVGWALRLSHERTRSAITMRCEEVRQPVVYVIHRPPGVRVESWERVRRVFNRVKPIWEAIT